MKKIILCVTLLFCAERIESIQPSNISKTFNTLFSSTIPPALLQEKMASIRRRIAAELIGLVPVITLLAVIKDKIPDTQTSLPLLFSLFICFGILSFGEPGKYLFKIKTVDAQNQPLSTETKIDRGSVKYISLFAMLIVQTISSNSKSISFFSIVQIVNLLFPLFRRDKRTLHDILSRTYVINKEKPPTPSTDTAATLTP